MCGVQAAASRHIWQARASSRMRQGLSVELLATRAMPPRLHEGHRRLRCALIGWNQPKPAPPGPCPGFIHSCRHVRLRASTVDYTTEAVERLPREEGLQRGEPEQSSAVKARSGSVLGEQGAAERGKARKVGAGKQEAEGVMKSVLQGMESMGLSDTNLESTNAHRLWVASACLALTSLLARALLHVSDPSSSLWVLTSAVLGYVLADMGTGLYHFGVDNYGDASVPVFGPQIDAFQGHHRRPWTITKRQFANNLQALARPVLAVIALALLLPLPPSPSRDAFLAVFFGCVMFSQQFHAWAHTPKPLLPKPVIALQDAGLLVSRKMHGAHHRPPFNCNYCIVSGLCNTPLDRLGVFAALERLVFESTGVPSRSWSTAVPHWLDNPTVAYYEDGSDDIA